LDFMRASACRLRPCRRALPGRGGATAAYNFVKRDESPAAIEPPFQTPSLTLGRQSRGGTPAAPLFPGADGLADCPGRREQSKKPAKKTKGAPGAREGEFPPAALAEKVFKRFWGQAGHGRLGSGTATAGA